MLKYKNKHIKAKNFRKKSRPGTWDAKEGTEGEKRKGQIM